MARVHVEKAPHYEWLLIFFRLLTLFFIGLFAWMVMNEQEGWWGIAIASFLMIWATLSFSNIHYELHEDAFEAWFWPFRSRAVYEEIEQVEIGSVPFLAGLGLHYLAGTWWYSTRYRPCVLIRRKGRSAIGITPKEPQSFLNMIEQRRKGSSKQR